MRTPRSRALVVELLRTLEDARNDVNGAGANSGGGVIQMPVLYHHGSYQELENCLGEMRDNGDRQLWWHVSMRYRWGNNDNWQTVPSRKTRQGREPVLPERSELRIQGDTVYQGGAVKVKVCLYTWADDVQPDLVTAGVDRLTELMYGGEWWRLTLPKPFLERLAVA